MNNDLKQRDTEIRLFETLSEANLTVITLGPKKKSKHLIDFLNDDLGSLLCIENNLLL